MRLPYEQEKKYMSKRKRDVHQLAQTLRIMGDETRLRVLLTVQQKECNVTELCKKLKMPQPSVSRHLSILRMGGLVNNRREGKHIHYSLADLSELSYGQAVQDMLAAVGSTNGE